VAFRIVPGIWEIIRGDVHIEQIRKVEPEDLLGRESLEPDIELLRPAYAEKRILVTGAGGSIGRELARQVRTLGPERLVLSGRGENSLFESRMALSGGNFPPAELVLADIRDAGAVRRVFEEVRPQVVLHAAAHKHVSFMENHPEEAILNNVVATRELVAAAEEFGTERFVMLSTDKAVHPHSVMGASKRMAELVLAVRTAAGSPTRLMAVRFGNVLGSRGSVVPLFLQQIQAGGPVTVSHPEVERYFMTVKEAALLVLHAGAMGTGGEIFVLDMGDQIKIQDLARELITLSGFRPDVDVAITISGLTPGEKLQEELVHGFETLEPTELKKIRVTRSPYPGLDKVTDVVRALEAAAREADRPRIRRLLEEFLPEATLTAGPEPV
jgi:FlaA1/EpsC-like NDP-sugar epimerase